MRCQSVSMVRAGSAQAGDEGHGLPVSEGGDSCCVNRALRLSADPARLALFGVVFQRRLHDLGEQRQVADMARLPVRSLDLSRWVDPAQNRL
jgi:hypothetical protein